MISVLVVDDHPMMRASMRMAIELAPDMHVVGEATNGLEAIARARDLQPDVIVMDLFLPVRDGVSAIREILATTPTARVLAITSATDDQRVVAAVRAGAAGYLLKSTSHEAFLQGVREVAAGRTFLPPEVVTKLASGLQRQADPPPAPAAPEAPAACRAIADLTTRQREVLALLGEGLTNRAIADRLVISESTVRVHVYNILDRLDLEDRNQAIVYAARCAAPPES